MTGEPLNNREINHIFDKLETMDNKLDIHITENKGQTTTLDSIEELAIKTNGRVTKLELWKSRAMGYSAGFLGILGLIITYNRIWG